MNVEKTGLLIAKLRKEKHLTQKQLADTLHVSDKAISRWETGLGFPETSLLPSLAKVLGVSVDELLEGQVKKVQKVEKERRYPIYHPLTKYEEICVKVLRMFAIIALLWGICIGYDEIENIVIALSKNEYYIDQWMKGILHCLLYIVLSFGLWKMSKKIEYRDIEEYNKAKQGFR